MKRGLASVIICAWNNWPDIELTIESALHQSYEPVEVIVIDNSSEDATADEVAGRFGGCIRYIRQMNRDTAGAYNAGFNVSDGEFIQFVDGDDVLSPNKLEKQTEILRADESVDVVYGDIGIFQTAAGPAKWDIIPARTEGDMLMAILSSKVGICTDLGMVYRREALARIGPWDENLYVEDLDYLLRAAWSGCRFKFCPGGPMGFARVHPRAKTRNSVAMELGNEAVWNKALGYVTKDPYRALLRVKLAQLQFHMAVSSQRMTRREGLAKLRSAYLMSPETIYPLLHAGAWLALMVPGGRWLARTPALTLARRLLSRWQGHRSEQLRLQLP